MSTNPKYTVTPLADVQHAVRIETEVLDSSFYDESHPLTLQACTPEALPLLQAFLSRLSLNTSWTGREYVKSAFLREGTLADGRTPLSISYCANRHRMPADWFSLLAGDEDCLLELCVTDERLAHQIFDALTAGTLQLKFAGPDPVQP